MTTSETQAPEPSTADKIREARAKLDALRTQLRAESEPERQARELAQLEREMQDERELADARKKFGADKVEQIKTDKGGVIVTCANPLIFQAYLDKGDSSTHAQMRLVLPTLVNMQPSQFEDLVLALPLTLLRVVDALYVLAGAAQRDVAGK